jgi:predicted nucleotidyltransferase
MKQSVIKKLQSALPAYPIEKAWIFGSYARGEETGESDVDLLVRFLPDAKIVGMDYIRMIVNIENALNKTVDFVKEGTLKKYAIDSVENDKILIYERAN